MITLESLEREIRKVAEDNPTQVIEDCHYADRGAGNPACLVGRALLNLGVDNEVLATVDGVSVSAWGATGDMEELLSDYVTEEAHSSNWIKKVQAKQDLSVPWAEAVQNTDSDLNGNS